MKTSVMPMTLNQFALYLYKKTGSAVCLSGLMGFNQVSHFLDYMDHLYQHPLFGFKQCSF